MIRDLTGDPLDRSRYPVDEWRLVETEQRADDVGTTETLFAVGNGYLGMRGNPEEGRDSHAHGTFINGFHETWPIKHAEEAFGFAHAHPDALGSDDAQAGVFEHLGDGARQVALRCVRLDHRKGAFNRHRSSPFVLLGKWAVSSRLRP